MLHYYLHVSLASLRDQRLSRNLMHYRIVRHTTVDAYHLLPCTINANDVSTQVS